MIRFNDIRAIAIDLDGTLLDTITDLSNAANRTLVALGLAPIPIETLKTFVGKGKAMHVRRSLAASLARAPDESEFADAMRIYEREYFAHISETTRPYPGVIEGLQALRARGFPLACVTNKAKAFTTELLRQQSLSDYFTLVLGGDELPRGKPDPLMITHTAEFFRVRPAQLLMIGDSRNDADAARAAGSPVVLMRYGYTEGEPLESIPNDGLFDSFTELLPLLPRALN